MTERPSSNLHSSPESEEDLEEYIEYDQPYSAKRNNKNVSVVGEWETAEGESLYQLSNSKKLVPEDGLTWLPDEEEAYERSGFPKKGNWQTKVDGLKNVSVLGRRKSDGWVQVETDEPVNDLKVQWVPAQEVTYLNDSSAEEGLRKKVEDLEKNLSTLQARIEEMEKRHQRELAAKDNIIEDLNKQLAEAKAGSAGDDTSTDVATPEDTPKNPDEEWLKNLLGAPVDYQPSPGRVERDWSLASADIIEEGGKQYVTLGRGGIRDNFQETQRVLLDDFKAWTRDSKAYENWKPPYGTEWYFNRAKKAKDGAKKPRDWFSWLKRRKGEKPDDEEDQKKNRRGYPLGVVALGVAAGALAATTAGLLIEELTDDESNASTNEINIIQNGNQQQNVVVTGEGQMGPYKVRIMPNPAPRHNTTTTETETETTPVTPSTTTKTEPQAPTTATTETTNEAPTTTETTPGAPSTTTETTPTGGSGQAEPGGTPVNEAQLHGMHLEHYNLEDGHGFVEVNLPKELNLIQPQEGGPYYITNAAGEPIVDNVRYETTGLLNEASRQALENNGYKVDYQRNAVFDNGQEVENYMSVITPAG